MGKAMIQVAFRKVAYAFLFLVLGWIGAIIWARGEHAFNMFVTDYTALAYLQKGDTNGAMVVLRASAEGNILMADKYRGWRAVLQPSDSMGAVFSEYGAFRKKLPESSRGPEDDEFERKLAEVLEEATAKKALTKGK
jgi:hypothetical protein